MPTPKFTDPELDLIVTMASIAGANGWGEGDYQDWDEKTSEILDSLLTKVAQMRDQIRQRKGGSR